MMYRVWLDNVARRPGVYLWTLVALGFAPRLAVIFASTGTDDVAIWRMIASYANEHGLAKAYRDLDYLNHPPLMSLLAIGLWNAARSLGLPFAWLIKLPGLLVPWNRKS